ncbi:hypothetical protein N3K66_005244 [Trichothecium roseum]|uniref:Uncharacterized protein n=1 Tax=Trichothecium roseum TaxID=47278 RepID=A0ACC0V3M7_9HYPO|nr:hypothetical protein N3K66_005244 [Trichothecium roseum]
MHTTLRRSCTACAKSKFGCDLRTPRCSRCVKRKLLCHYANEPLTATTSPVAAAPGMGAGGSEPGTWPAGDFTDSSNGLSSSSAAASSNSSSPIAYYSFGSVDPFNSCPPTRLPTAHVQRLVHAFLNKIAFQYYPLDLGTTTNPFLTSWWPLALGDPALFHVSLQTACLDEEYLAQRGFRSSDILMAESVALLRRKIEDPSLAVQDGTMNSIITLAAIEFGKGHFATAKLHVDGVKRLVDMRGGIDSVRQTSPLTARMVSWVSMLVMGHPQFQTQDDWGTGDGIPPIPEWQLDNVAHHDDFAIAASGLAGALNGDVQVKNVLMRLRNIFRRAQTTPLEPTRLHDLTSFVIHRLLSSKPGTGGDNGNNGNDPLAQSDPVTECIRYATILYMFILQGPTYYSHEHMMSAISFDLKEQLQLFSSGSEMDYSIHIWLLAVGMVASTGSPNHGWFLEEARGLVSTLQIDGWQEVFDHIKSVLWLDLLHSEHVFQSHWRYIC